MAVPFRFDTVLRVREAERDRCRVALTQGQRREAELLAERDQVSSERLVILAELRAMHDSGDWPADRALARQQHAEHLAAELIRIERTLRDVATSLTRCRTESLEADTSVKALEKLAGRHAADQRRAEQTSAERDRDDSWRAA